MGDYEIVRPHEGRARRRRRRRIRAAVQRASALALAVVLAAAVAIAKNSEDDEREEIAETSVRMSAAPVAMPEPEPVAEPVDDGYILYDIELSEELQHYTQDVCEEYGVSYPLVLAVMQKESEYDPKAVSSTGDHGIMQINQCNHDWLEGELGITDWYDPEQSILAGVYILSRFDYDDPHQILMSYNCGPSGAKDLWADGIYSTEYSRAVVEILDGLEVMNDG